MLISIVIPSYQRCESVREVLTALASQTVAPEQFEVIVSIDGSTDGTETMLSQITVPYSLRWINGKQGGPGMARNRGAALANGEIVLFLDDDIIATPDLLAEHLSAHEENPGGVCLGQVRTQSACSLSPWEQYLNQRYEEHYDKLNTPGYRPLFWDCLSGNISLGRELLDRSGGFDAEFAAFKHDDIEFGYRLAALRVQFAYRPGALGYHRFVKSMEAGLRDAHAEGESAQRLANQYPDLSTKLIDARWSRYNPIARVVLHWVRHDAHRHTWLITLSSILLRLACQLSLPLPISRPVFQLVYHMHFWNGVCTELVGNRHPFSRSSDFHSKSTQTS